MIYKLTEEERELITVHKQFYADLFKYGNTVLDIGFQGIIKDYELTIYSMIYRILELLDTLKVMTENSLINSGFIVLRSLVEIVVQLCYIVSDETKMQERATVLQMFDIKRTAKDEVAFYKKMDETECYRMFIKIIKQDKSYPNWYSYCENKKTSLEGLFTLIGCEKIYSDLYRPLCIEAHQINHLEANIVCTEDKFKFKPFRMFENHVLLLNSVLTIMTLLLHRLVKIYGNEELNNDWDKYERKLNQYIEDNHYVSKIEKRFNPLLKWF